MKTIDDLPVEILAHILLFVTKEIDIFVKFRSISSKWNEAVKHRLSMVKYLIQNINNGYALIQAETMYSKDPGYFDDSDWDDKYTRYFIILMEMLPCLQAVKLHRSLDLVEQNKIFSYFNSRLTLKALGINTYLSWKEYDIKPEFKEAVKLKNITMLSIMGRNVKKFIEYFFPTDHEFDQIRLGYTVDLSFLFQKKSKIRKLYHEISCEWFRENEALIMPNNLCDLEIFGVYSHKPDILKYLSKVTSVCPKLTSIHVALEDIDQEPIKNFKQFNQIENLVIWTHFEPWLYIEKILKMYPMVKNLSIKDSHELSQDKVLGIFRWMPNLSILDLVNHKDWETDEFPWIINVDHLVSAYKQLHGRLIKIRVREKVHYTGVWQLTDEIFASEFDFMKHIFYPDHVNIPHLLLE